MREINRNSIDKLITHILINSCAYSYKIVRNLVNYMLIVIMICYCIIS